MNSIAQYPYFKLDSLNGFVAVAIGLFLGTTLIYSLKAIRFSKLRSILYYAYLVLTAVASIAAVLSNNMIILLCCWGFLGLALYLLINMGDEGSSLAAKKTLVIVGGTDALMLLGVGIIYYLSQTMQIDVIKLELNSGLSVFAYLCIAIACFAKAGVMPFHSWIPDCAKAAPLPVVAYLPASLDKLLGIYLLARASLGLFVMNTAMNTFLMLIGALTIIAGVMMALVQHNMKRLLGYHAVSQVGYMVLGIGTANPIGIAGALFHMLNNAIYKSSLFLGAGNVEYRTKTSELSELGGLSRLMPITYVSFMISSLAISGVPPFNGFVSKWLIYQGLVSGISSAESSWQLAVKMFCLSAAMFGSALTLASFMKLLHAVFLGQRLNTLKDKEIKEVSFPMWLPVVLLSLTCVLFGVFAFGVPLKYFIFPAVSQYQSVSAASLAGVWSPVLATMLIILGLILGFFIFRLMKAGSSLRKDSAFIGGEPEVKEENMVTGVEFYNTIKETGFLSAIYNKAEKGVFDIYEQAKAIFSVSRAFQYLHNGVLPTYLVWILLGMVGLFFVLMR